MLKSCHLFLPSCEQYLACTFSVFVSFNQIGYHQLLVRRLGRKISREKCKSQWNGFCFLNRIFFSFTDYYKYWVTNQKKKICISLAIRHDHLSPSSWHTLTCLFLISTSIIAFSYSDCPTIYWLNFHRSDSIATSHYFSGITKIAIAFLFITFLQ